MVMLYILSGIVALMILVTAYELGRLEATITWNKRMQKYIDLMDKQLEKYND